MALITQYSSANRVVLEDLSVTYAVERIHGSWAFETGVGVTTTYKTVWQATRRATKHYRYVGMTRSAANDCAAAMRTKYTRAIKFSEIPSGVASEFTDIAGGNVPMANVACEYAEGQMWAVDVTVDEIDTRLRVSSIASASALFSAENQRDYDAA